MALKQPDGLRLAGLALALALSACAQPPQEGVSAAGPEQARSGYRNNYIAQVDKPFGDFLRWRYRAWRDNLPPPPRQATPVAAPELTRLQANAVAYRSSDPGRAVPSATWIGHATALVQAGGLSVLTDPIFSERASPLSFLGPRRAYPPGIGLDQLPPMDVVLVSHNHYDHLDLDSLQRLNHLNPAEAVQAHRDLGARQSVGIHWGTFELTDEPLDQPPQDLRAATAAAGLRDDEFFLLAIGQSRWLAPRNQAAPALAGARP